MLAGIFLLSWEIYGRANPLLVPAPTAIGSALVTLIVSGHLHRALADSLRLLAAGLALSIIFGVPVGFLLGRSTLVRLTFGPYITATYVTPVIIFVPIFIVLLGYGFAARLCVVFLSAVFPLIFNAMAAAREVPALEEMAHSFQATRRQIMSSVTLPAATPYLLTGLRQSFGRALIGVVTAEAFLRLGGIGGLIFLYGSQFAPAYLLAAMLVLPALGLSSDYLLKQIEIRLMPWRNTNASYTFP